MAPRRLKLVTILVGVLLAGVGLLTWTQPWFGVVVESPQGGQLDLTAAGDVAGSPVSALSLAALALVGALTIAGRVFRVVLGLLQFALGASIAVTAGTALSDPVRASGSVVTDATGVDGQDSLRALVSSTSATPWPWLALVVGVLGALLGVGIVVTSGAWPQAGRKYTATRLVPADPASDPSATWDSLSVGDDPTDPTDPTDLAAPDEPAAPVDDAGPRPGADDRPSR
ncbi:Trp biosynthesis-associated membrane protein [Frigoribacterium sp. VKM Ac-2530]|uniref:Trp biosynthesis-associated membrane protein n=1 Tax=Frigoribacterium sp. VKM Ac-2530 TaxID=2783822 RepID=UPI00188ADF98|nr:Trp biosynthesis-associated membrane protein [Frigoribacterium sp. VKM Ac-2530]MBF4578272.1 Trp biosynthesis-associated membrane protein [Frigoribacterium sp. VKM Ac-2530]